MVHIYKVSLTPEERKEVQLLIQKGGKGYHIRHAQVLLHLDCSDETFKPWTYKKISEAYGMTEKTVGNIAQRFVMEGLTAALGRKVQVNRHRKVTGEIEAKMSQLACSQPPAGHAKWTMQLLADELIRLEIIDYITDTTVCEVMKKTKLSRGSLKNGASRKEEPTM